jgi:Fic family protein
LLIERYDHTDDMAECLASIDKARQLLESHLVGPELWHGVIRRQVMAAVVHYSTAIEGNVLTRDQVESIIAGETIEVPEKDRTEALNYYKAMRWSQSRAQDAEWQLSSESILTLQFMVGSDLGGSYEPLGRYREGQNTVEDRRTGEVIYWPPRATDMRPLMDELVEWIRRRSDGLTSPYVVNALAHLNFVAIHPFSDGNGRVARLLCSLLMMREGYKAQAFWSLEQFLGEQAVDYGSVLAETLGPRWRPDQVLATDWIRWYLSAVAAQVSASERRMRRSLAEVAAVIGAMSASSDMPSDPKMYARFVMPVWLVLTAPDRSLARRRLSRYVNVSTQTLARDLQHLKQQGLLTSSGRGRGAHYVPGPVVLSWGNFDQLVDLAEAVGLLGASAVRGRIAQSRESSPTLFEVS